MNIDFQRRVDRIAGTCICRILSLFSIMRKDTPVRAKPRKIMVILLSEMGSLVLARPMFDHIKKKYPNASIYVLLFEQNKEVLEILKVIPQENIFTVSNSSIKKLLGDSIHVLKKMRKIGIDTVLDCELFSRVGSIYSFLIGARIRVGFHPYTQEGLFRGDFINRPVLYNPYQHISQQFITLVEAIESGNVPTVKRQVPIDCLKIQPMEVSRDEIDGMLRRFKNDFPNVTGKKIVLIYPGGGLLPIRAWPLSYYCMIAEDLIQNGFAVGVIGLKSDSEIASVILSHCRNANCIDLTGYTKTVRELMLLFHFASLLITNDGGPGHFASMTPVSTIVFYGPETPTLYGALDNKSVNFYANLSCSPCLTAYNHRNSPCDGNNLCLKSIHPEAVLKKSYEILNSQKGNILK
jgi:ADP-heptose:LPS heptosyltransferase